MNLIELQRALGQLRLGGIAAVLETRLRQAQSEAMAPIDLISCLVSDELTRRCDRLLERRRKQAAFRDPQRTLDNFDFTFNPKMNRSLVFDLATCAFIGKREDALFLGPGGTGKSHLAQAIGQAAIQQGHRVLYRETHILLDDLADAVADGTRKEFMESLATVPLLIIDDFGMRKLPLTQVRHERGRRWLKSFKISSGNGRVSTTFAMVLEMFRQVDAELAEQGFLLRGWFGNSAQSDLATVGCRQHDVGTLQSGKQRNRSHRRQGLGVIDTTQRWRRHNGRPALQQMFQRYP